ncbi:nucleotide sugar dehydrogenase, partial [Candidatus Bathyarchaeota archaeon]
MSERGLCISVYGMGYVGLTISAAWLRAGYRIIGVDILREKVEALSRGLITHIEPEVRDEIARALLEHRFEATTDGIKASERSRIKIIAIPIGLDDEGKPILKNLRETVEVIA